MAMHSVPRGLNPEIWRLVLREWITVSRFFDFQNSYGRVRSLGLRSVYQTPGDALVPHTRGRRVLWSSRLRCSAFATCHSKTSCLFEGPD